MAITKFGETFKYKLDMILKNATIKYKGYDPDTLSKSSHKRICKSCDKCGRVGYTEFKRYTDLCRSCCNKKLKIIVICKQCNKKFKVIPALKNRRFCCKKCKDKYQRGENSPTWKGGEITKFCKQCGKEFRTISCRKYTSHFCSCKCNGEWQSARRDFFGNKNPMFGRTGKNNPNYKSKIILICEICGDEFEVIPSQKDRKFCSQKCYSKWQSENLVGENAPGWKGGIARARNHVLPERNCIKLNQRFEGSSGHHITKSIIIYIPTVLHEHIRHNLLNGKNMGIINLLSLQFINGEL